MQRKLRHALLFTSDGHLDFGWLILAVCVVFGLGIMGLEAAGKVDVSNAAWAWFGSFTAMSFIAGAAIGRARLIAKSSLPGDVAKGIASALPKGVRQPTLYDMMDE